MTEYKNQHYVPRYYLKRFSPDANENQIYVYDKVLNRSLGLVGVNNVASASYFYDFSVNDKEEKHIAEKELHRLEQKFKRAIELGISVANGGTADYEQRIDMSLCVAIQLIRTLDFRKDLIDTAEKFATAMMESVIELVKPELLSDIAIKAKYSKDAAAFLHAELMWDSDFVTDIAYTLMNRIWVIGVNKTGIPLYTSDTPVVMKSHNEKSMFIPNPNSGPDFAKAIEIVIESNRPAIKEKGVEIVFPLNPECMLIILENSHFKSLQERDGMRYNLQPEQIAYYNALQVIESRRQIYSKSNDFKLAEQLCNENPDLCSVNREKSKIEKWKWSKEV